MLCIALVFTAAYRKCGYGGQTESLQNVGGGGEGVYNVLTLQKSRGGGGKSCSALL